MRRFLFRVRGLNLLHRPRNHVVEPKVDVLRERFEQSIIAFRGYLDGFRGECSLSRIQCPAQCVVEDLRQRHLGIADVFIRHDTPGLRIGHIPELPLSHNPGSLVVSVWPLISDSADNASLIRRMSRIARLGLNAIAILLLPRAIGGRRVGSVLRTRFCSGSLLTKLRAGGPDVLCPAIFWRFVVRFGIEFTDYVLSIISGKRSIGWSR